MEKEHHQVYQSATVEPGDNCIFLKTCFWLSGVYSSGQWRYYTVKTLDIPLHCCKAVFVVEYNLNDVLVSVYSENDLQPCTGFSWHWPGFLQSFWCVLLQWDWGNESCTRIHLYTELMHLHQLCHILTLRPARNHTNKYLMDFCA